MCFFLFDHTARTRVVMTSFFLVLGSVPRMPAGVPLFPRERRRAAKGSGDADVGRADGETGRQFGHVAAAVRLGVGRQTRQGAARLRRHPETGVGTLAANHPGKSFFSSPVNRSSMRVRSCSRDGSNVENRFSFERRKEIEWPTEGDMTLEKPRKERERERKTGTIAIKRLQRSGVERYD